MACLLNELRSFQGPQQGSRIAFKSLILLNWVGLTKMTNNDNIIFRITSSLLKTTCPLCKAPIVGTNPIDFTVTA